MLGQPTIGNDAVLSAVANFTPVSIIGRNFDVDILSCPEDVWAGDGQITLPTAARIHAIVSTSAQDKGTATAGTGMRTATVSGLNEAWNLVSETVTLNGTTPVNTSNSYFTLYIVGATYGSSGDAEGVISATAATDNTVTNKVQVYFTRSSSTVYQVPAGYTAYIVRWWAAMQSSTADAEANLSLQYQLFGGSWNARGFTLNLKRTNGRRILEKKLEPGLELPAKTVIKIVVDDVTKNNTDICAGYDLILVAD